MRTIAALALSVIIMTGLGLTPAFAQMMDQAPVTVMLDKDSYAEGDTIMVSGMVLQRHGGGMSILVKAPNGNVVYTAQPQIGPDNGFSLSIATGGTMTQAGTYTVEANYSLDARSPRIATAMFMYTPGDKPSMMVDGTEISPDYSIVGGSVLGMSTNPSANTLMINVRTTDDGQLTITLPRTLIDSTLVDGTDDTFFVLIDGEEVQFEEVATTADSRTLMVPFPTGIGTIEIIGTYVAVPEFGTIAALILAVAIVSIVAVSARSRLSLAPRV